MSFSINGQPISDDGGEVVWERRRTREEVIALGLDPDNPGVFYFEVVNGDGTPKK